MNSERLSTTCCGFGEMDAKQFEDCKASVVEGWAEAPAMDLSCCERCAEVHDANPRDVAPTGTNPCAIPIAAEKPRGSLGDGYVGSGPTCRLEFQEQPWCAVEAGKVVEVIERESRVQ